MSSIRPFVLYSLVLLLGLSGLRAQDEAWQSSTLPAGTEATAISAEELGLRAEPLRKEELAKETEHWAALLQAQVTGINQLEIEKLGAKDEARRSQLVDEISKRHEAKNKLMARLKVVIQDWEAKGGDATEIRAYADSVTGIKVDVTDTFGAWQTIRNWVISEEGGIALAINFGMFLAILIVARILAGLIAGLVSKALTRVRKTPELLRNFMVNTTRKVVFFIGLIVALEKLGVEMGPFLAAIGAAGFIIGFALQGTLSNFAAGLMILLYRPYDIGDVVTVGGETGKVTAMTLVSTTVLKPDNQIVIVPNSSIWGNVITNITGSDTRRVDMVFGIGYGDDMAHAQRVLEEILGNHDKILKDPAPVVTVGELADSSVNFLVRPWVKTADYWDVHWDITRAVKERFDAEGISIPFPQQDVHMHQVGEVASA